MNKQWIFLHLVEAVEELKGTIEALQSDLDYEEAELQLAIVHAYSHINTAWNSRNEPIERIENHSEDDFYKWRDFPSDTIREMILGA